MCHFQEKALGRSKPFTTFPSHLWEITEASEHLFQPESSSQTTLVGRMREK